MRLRGAHIVVSAALLAALCGCGRPARVISPEKMTRIYHDMFLADQWLRDNPEARKMADTTLFFDPVFRSHGYSFEDFDRSVQYYLDHPDKYTKILGRASERLRKEGERMQKAADELTAREIELDRFRRIYQAKDFSTDSLRWSGPQTLWPVYRDPADTLSAADSLAQADSLKQGGDSLLGPADGLGVPEEEAGSDTWVPVDPVDRSEQSRPVRIRVKDMEKIEPE